MNSEYKVFKFKSENLDDFNDHISIEEPVETVSYTHLRAHET